MNDNEIQKLCDYSIKIASSIGCHPYDVINEYLCAFVNDVEKRQFIGNLSMDYFKTNYDDNNYPWRFY